MKFVRKAAGFAVKAFVFSKTPQGKRDIAIVVAAVSAAADFIRSVS